MLRSLVVGGFAMLSLAMGSTAYAQSSCDAGITKAVARKVSCKLRLYAAAQKTGRAADAAKLTKCEEKFAASCAKAQSKNDCQAQTSSCAAIEAKADAAVDDLRGGPPPSPTTTPTATATATATLDPSRPCGQDPGGTCGGACERGDCGPAGFTGECVCLRPCGRDPGGTCGGICDFYPLEQCVEDAGGNCTCFLPCQALGGIGQCHGDCPPTMTCSFTGVPSNPCACF
jgi:hypothetical protein